jgi:hypothetical protein
MKRCDKKGQFYLIAAVVIIGLIIGFAAVSNTAKKSSYIKVYDLEKEMGIESDMVLEFGIYNQYDDNDMSLLLEHFSALYNEYSGDDVQMYFIIGDFEEINLYEYAQEIGGDITLSGIGTGTTLTIQDTQLVKTELEIVEGNKVVIKIGEIEKEFELKQGENFYYIITQNVGEDEIQVSN